MRIVISNQQAARKIDLRVARRWLDYCVRRLRRLRPDRTWSVISLILMDDAGISEINLRSLAHEGTTDVISFAYPPFPGEPAAGWMGEVIVNVALAGREGVRRVSPDHELALYVAHGCDHLSDADDRDPADRRRMRQREQRWLRLGRAQGCWNGLFATARTRTRRSPS